MLPRSVARWYDPFVTIAVIIALFAALRDTSLTDRNFVIAILVPLTLVMLSLEALRTRRTLPARPAIAPGALWHSVAVKYCGVTLVVGASLLLWWLTPLYRGVRYQPMLELAPVVLPWLAALLLPYLLVSEWRLGTARDYAWHIGILPLGLFSRRHRNSIDWGIVRDGALSMLIRTIFLPLNLCYAIANIGILRSARWDTFFDLSLAHGHAMLMMTLYMLLIFAIIPGYLFSFRLLNTHTRAIDRSWFGWMVTLSCYPPLLAGVFTGWFSYRTVQFEEPFMKPWIMILGDTDLLLYGFAAAILFCELVHLWGEAILGIRSSNLSHRGIITTGPFRYLRHPIYFIKCVGWFLIFLPILMGETFTENLRLGIMFLGVCVIYYLRCIAEERMLSADPDYVAYATYLDRHGLLSFAGRLCPVLTFAWRHRRWHTRPTPAQSGVAL